jgi:hypothetical protein
MISWVLYRASTVCALIILVSFGLFALDQADEGSKRQQRRVDEINEVDPGPRTEAKREKDHSKVREAIDDANDFLVKPFAGVTDSTDVWVQRGIPSLLALLAFGLLLRLVAGYARRLP